MSARYRTCADLNTGMTSAVKRNRDLRLVKAPQELRPFFILDGLASKAEQRSAACLAPSSRAISGRISY